MFIPLIIAILRVMKMDETGLIAKGTLSGVDVCVAVIARSAIALLTRRIFHMSLPSHCCLSFHHLAFPFNRQVVLYPRAILRSFPKLFPSGCLYAYPLTFCHRSFSLCFFLLFFFYYYNYYHYLYLNPLEDLRALGASAKISTLDDGTRQQQEHDGPSVRKKKKQRRVAKALPNAQA